MQLLILSEYFLKIMIRVGLHIMIPSVVQAFCIIISVKLKVISSWYLNSHRIRNQTLTLDCHKHKLLDSSQTVFRIIIVFISFLKT